MPAWISSKTTKVAVFSLSLVPLALLLVGFRSNTLGANPIEYITHDTEPGRSALYCLLSRSRRAADFQQPNLIAFRRMLGFSRFSMVACT
jgi:DMSO/TMAO reductase YedYZ heme-binding membrane subunit